MNTIATSPDFFWTNTDFGGMFWRKTNLIYGTRDVNEASWAFSILIVQHFISSAVV